MSCSKSRICGPRKVWLRLGCAVESVRSGVEAGKPIDHGWLGWHGSGPKTHQVPDDRASGARSPEFAALARLISTITFHQELESPSDSTLNHTASLWSYGFTIMIPYN